MTNSLDNDPRYYILPYLKTGMAALMQGDVESGKQRADVNIDLIAEGNGSPIVNSISPPGGVKIYGPGDILGFKEDVITRLEPKKNIGDFEPNYFPFIEFEQPDFPWRYTAKAVIQQENTDNLRLKPWITLIVLKAENDEKEFREDVESNSEVPCIGITDINSLPDLEQSWRWAHVQITTDSSIEHSEEAIKNILENKRNAVVSRLMCPRRLKPGTLYNAFVVPTFMLGVQAGRDDEIDSKTGALELAWNSETNEITLPYYYKWEFRTGQRGDFESLVRRLEPLELTGLGRRDIDCTKPGYGIQSENSDDNSVEEPLILGLEGALMSLDMEPTRWGQDVENETVPETGSTYRKFLTDLINEPKADLTEGNDKPKITPPIYGRWHGAIREVNPVTESWLHTLNIDPRHRMAAGFGTAVVQKQQEQILASAWDQLGAIDKANEILRQAQLGREASRQIYDQRIKVLPLETSLQITSPVHSRIRIPILEEQEEPTTVRHLVENSRIPSATFDPALQRIARKRGPVRKKQQTDGEKEQRGLLERLNDGSLQPAGPPPEPDGANQICKITFNLLEESGLLKTAYALCPDVSKEDPYQIAKKLNLFCEENISCEFIDDIPERPDFLDNSEESHSPRRRREGDNEQARKFRELLLAICDLLEPEEELTEPDPLDLDEIKNKVINSIDPQKTIDSRTLSRIKLVDVPKRPDNLDPIMAAPEFDTPMYYPLQEISQDLLLPGIETVSPNTVGLLKTNDRFVESYQIGLNHEIARELLFHEYPTDQRGSYSRQFWDVNGYIPTAEDKEFLNQKLQEYLSEQDLDNEIESVTDLSHEIKELILLRNGIDADKILYKPEPQIKETLETVLKDEFLEEKLKDIKLIHTWGDSKLGNNDNRPDRSTDDEENIVLIIRGDLLKKYPNTRIYAVEAKWIGQKRVPGLSEHLPEEIESGEEKNPIFGGELPPDITFFGFNMGKDEAMGNSIPGSHPGWFIVIEERISETRFGLDKTNSNNTDLTDWDDLNWGHIEALDLDGDEYLDGKTPNLKQDDGTKIDLEPKWDDSDDTTAASIAWITMQKPVRISIHASQMIPEVDLG